MTQQRFRVDGITREEVPHNRDGLGEMREAISAAHAAGNLVLLGELQAKYRSEVRAYREAAQGRSPKRQAAVTPATPKVVRAPEREIAGILLNFGPQPTAMESGEAVMLDVTRESVERWLIATDPATVPLVCHHEVGPVGHFLRFQLCDGYIEAAALADESPAAALMLRGIDDGTLPGFSFAAKIVKSHPTGQVVRGLPLVIADELEIFEAGPSLEPSDPEAIITLVRGRQPLWRQVEQQVEDARERIAYLRSMRPVPSLR